jgi:hypothetical protein
VGQSVRDCKQNDEEPHGTRRDFPSVGKKTAVGDSILQVVL